MDAVGVVDPTVVVGCLVTVAVAGAVMIIMKYSFASQEAEYGEHISTLYGSGSTLKNKAAKAEKKKKGKQDTVSPCLRALSSLSVWFDILLYVDAFNIVYHLHLW